MGGNNKRHGRVGHYIIYYFRRRHTHTHLMSARVGQHVTPQKGGGEELRRLSYTSGECRQALAAREAGWLSHELTRRQQQGRNAKGCCFHTLPGILNQLSHVQHAHTIYEPLNFHLYAIAFVITRREHVW